MQLQKPLPLSLNKLVLHAQLVRLEPLRYTPAGIPLLNLLLRHHSEQIEAGMKRKVECEIEAVIVGELALKNLKLGTDMIVHGFLAKRSMKSTQLVMHINNIDFVG